MVRAARWRGWEEEGGSEEEVEFLAAVAVEETAEMGIEGKEMDELDFSIRSHILLAVMQAEVKNKQERECFLGELKRRLVQKERIGEEGAGRWVKEALGIMELYVRMWHGVWPGVEERGEMLWRILVEDSQLFARWRVSPPAKQLTFGLGPRSKGFRVLLRLLCCHWTGYRVQSQVSKTTTQAPFDCLPPMVIENLIFLHPTGH